jgi:hypothetical protein
VTRFSDCVTKEAGHLRWSEIMLFTSKTDIAIWELIESIDLEPVRESYIKLLRERKMNSRVLKMSLKEYVSNSELAYKRFLFLCKKYPKAAIVPSLAMDDFWHKHILFTQKYADDCDKIFGRFLHHGPANKNNAAETKKNWKASKDLFEKEFGPFGVARAACPGQGGAGCACDAKPGKPEHGCVSH